MVTDHLALALSNLQLRDRLRQQAIRDPLTGLFNRRYLDETLVHELLRASHHGSSVGCMMMDIDHFKCYNDTYGHDGGDALLRALANLLTGRTRVDDIACRFGGEEFLVVLPGASLKTTIERAKQICNEVRQLQVRHEGISLGQVTISIGVACFPYHATTPDALISAADDALYQAKSQGRDRVCIANTVVYS